jgi:hypothetical protein
VDLAARHIAILSHRHLRVAEAIGTDERDNPASSISVARDLRQLCELTSSTPNSPRLASLPGEVVGVAQGAAE